MHDIVNQNNEGVGLQMNTAKNSRTKNMVLTALFAALIAVCSWITVPGPVPFTLQTMAVFLAVGLLGGKNGSICVLLYILLGAVGLPVFAGFKGGIGALLGTTGGYILGFLFSALLMWAMEKTMGQKTWVLILSMVLGLLVCYAFGTVWFRFVYLKTTGAVGWMTVLGWCVFPFLIPDGLKIALASLLTLKLRKYLK